VGDEIYPDLIRVYFAKASSDRYQSLRRVNVQLQLRLLQEECKNNLDDVMKVVRQIKRTGNNAMKKTGHNA
jgi:23S rRNA maturation mini-RNase III